MLTPVPLDPGRHVDYSRPLLLERHNSMGIIWTIIGVIASLVGMVTYLLVQAVVNVLRAIKKSALFIKRLAR